MCPTFRVTSPGATPPMASSGGNLATPWVQISTPVTPSCCLHHMTPQGEDLEPIYPRVAPEIIRISSLLLTLPYCLHPMTSRVQLSLSVTSSYGFHPMTPSGKDRASSPCASPCASPRASSRVSSSRASYPRSSSPTDNVESTLCAVPDTRVSSLARNVRHNRSV